MTQQPSNEAIRRADWQAAQRSVSATLSARRDMCYAAKMVGAFALAKRVGPFPAVAWPADVAAAADEAALFLCEQWGYTDDLSERMAMHQRLEQIIIYTLETPR